MKNGRKFFQNHWYTLSVVFILIFAALFRFYNYENRFVLDSDQANNALVARYALKTLKLPLLGPFSSAGPFQTGGEWYWFVMLGTFLFPFSPFGPWIFLTLLYLAFIVLIILFGSELQGKIFGILCGLLACLSTQQITQGANLTNQSPISIFALLALWSGIRYMRQKSGIYLLLLGLSVSTAAAIHLQGVLLFLMVPLVIILTRSLRKMHILMLLAGLIVPLLPILIADLNHNFFNFRNMLYYYLYDQYKIPFEVLGRRWLTYLFVFWPETWAYVIGGNTLLAYILLLSTGITIFWKVLKRKISQEWFFILASLAAMAFVLRYTRTPLFDSYIVFLHPFILLLSAYTTYWIFKSNKLVGSILLLLILSGSINRDILHMMNPPNQAVSELKSAKQVLLQKYPNRTFAIYDYKYHITGTSLPLVLLLDAAGRINDSGMKIGVVKVGRKEIFKKSLVLLYKTDRYRILSLEGLSNDQLRKDLWAPVNPSYVYKSTEEWYKK